MRSQRLKKSIVNNCMGIFDRFRKKNNASAFTKADGQPSKELDAVKQQKAKQDAKEGPTAMKAVGGSMLSATMLRTPHVSEKAARLADRGTYVFDVPIAAEKLALKRAIETLYHVKVESVRTIRQDGKMIRRGRTMGKRRSWKKAMVTLKKGQRIDIYEGV